MLFYYLSLKVMSQNSLGSKTTSQPSKNLEIFKNPNPQRDIHIHMQIPEFTCLCPKTGQPDLLLYILIISPINDVWN